LKGEGIDIGPSDIDGQWGPHTRKAICIYLSDNFADFKSMEEFKTEFGDKMELPECDDISKDNLILYISKMF
jgi:hypothetical protein